VRGQPITVDFSKLQYQFDNPGNVQAPVLLFPSLNGEVRDGYLASRFPYTKVVAPTLTENLWAMCGWITSANTGNFLFGAGETKLWRYSSFAGTWTAATGTALNGGPQSYNIVRFFKTSAGTADGVILANGQDYPAAWDNTSAAYTSLAAGPLAPNCCMVLLGRVLFGNVKEGGVRWGSRIRWSALNDQATYPALAYADLVDTSDNIVAMQTMNRSAGLIYKAGSVWMATATGGSDAAAFRFEIVGYAPGPISAGAVVVGRGGMHYYLGRDFNIYRCDGSSVQKVINCGNILTQYLAGGPTGGFCGTYLAHNETAYFFLPLSVVGVSYQVVLCANLVTGAIYFERFEEFISAATTLQFVDSRERVVISPGFRTDVYQHAYDDESVTDALASPFDVRVMLPILPGVEWEIQGIDLMLRGNSTRTDNLKVSWLTGTALDVQATLPGTTLNGLTESTPVTYALQNTKRIQDNLTVGLRARVAVLRLLQATAPNPYPIQIERLDIFAWPRAQAI
jgi:hypothetical protein